MKKWNPGKIKAEVDKILPVSKWFDADIDAIEYKDILDRLSLIQNIVECRHLERQVDIGKIIELVCSPVNPHLAPCTLEDYSKAVSVRQAKYVLNNHIFPPQEDDLKANFIERANQVQDTHVLLTRKDYLIALATDLDKGIIWPFLKKEKPKAGRNYPKRETAYFLDLRSTRRVEQITVDWDESKPIEKLQYMHPKYNQMNKRVISGTVILDWIRDNR